VERLLGSGDGVSRQPDFQGRTLLHYATKSSRAAQTINVLLTSGVDIDVHAKDSCGEQRWSRREFLGIGAKDDLCEFNGDRRTAMQLAARCGRREAVDVLSAYSGTGDWDLKVEERVEISGRLGECEGRR
jgi:ankyrin repeat protein